MRGCFVGELPANNVSSKADKSIQKKSMTTAFAVCRKGETAARPDGVSRPERLSMTSSRQVTCGLVLFRKRVMWLPVKGSLPTKGGTVDQVHVGVNLSYS